MRYKLFLVGVGFLCLLLLMLWPTANISALQQGAEETLSAPLPPEQTIILGLTRFYTENIAIPTYPYAEHLYEAFNPTFNMTYTVLDWETYKAADPTPQLETYLLLVMENEYLKVTVLPELGGRIYQIIDQATGENHVYQNPVIKPTGWGPPEQGWWLAAGGIEWGLPVEEHGYESGVPWFWDVLTSTQGVTVTVWDTQATDRIRASVDLFLPAGHAYLDVIPHLENPTDAPIDYKFWSNAALAPGSTNQPVEDFEFIFPVDEMSIHSTGDSRLPGHWPTLPTGPDYRISWPEYNGVDFSRLGNWDEWAGFFAYPQAAADYMGVYNHEEDVGMIRVFPSQIARGAKVFSYGWEHPLPWSQWTDEASGGVEIHGGVAPTFWDTARLEPGASLSWRETWYPVRNTGGISSATLKAALHLSEQEGEIRIDLHSTVSLTASSSQLYAWDATTCVQLGHWELPKIAPFKPYSVTMPAGSRALSQLSVAYVDAEENTLVAFNDTNCLHAVQPAPHLGYGLNVRNMENIEELAKPLDFEWIKLWEEYMPSDLDPPVPQSSLPSKVLYLINCGGYINDLQAWGAHVDDIAQAGLGIVDAYEICNETNVYTFWDGLAPDPRRYAEMLCIANARIKAIDPQAVVVSGGLAPVGRISGIAGGWRGNDGHAMDERLYLEGMLDAGAGTCMDAFGYHPYGFAASPEQDPSTVENGFAFRGIEVMHDLLVDAGLNMPVWATEFNWLRNPSEDGVNCEDDRDYVTNFKWQAVSAQTQADYLVRAFQYADRHWPWLHGMFIWNLDWHDYLTWLPCVHSRYYALRQQDGTALGTPTLAYEALGAMDKRPGLSLEPRLEVVPAQQTFLVDLDAPRVLTASFSIRNAGYGTFTWTATLDPQSDFTPTMWITQGQAGDALALTIDPAAIETKPFPGTMTVFWRGTFSSTLTLTTTPTEVLNVPQTLTVTIKASPKLNYLHLPFVVNDYKSTQTYTHSEPQGPSKIGVHAIANGGTVDFVRMVKQGGGHVAVVKGLTFGYLKDVKEISPETVTLGRWPDPQWEAIQTGGDVPAQAALYMNMHMSYWEAHKAYVDYWEILNEVDPPTIEGHVWLAEFFIEAMNIAEANGYKLALFSYSMGVPEIYEWQAMVETGVFARAKQGGHILSLHEYANPMSGRWGEAMPLYPGQDPNDPSLPRYADRGVLTGRYRHLYRDILIPRDEVIPLVITECNLAIEDPEERAEIFLDEMFWYDDRLREDEYVIGMTIFTLGGLYWSHFDFREFLPDLANHIIILKDDVRP